MLKEMSIFSPFSMKPTYMSPFSVSWSNLEETLGNLCDCFFAKTFHQTLTYYTAKQAAREGTELVLDDLQGVQNESSCFKENISMRINTIRKFWKECEQNV